MGLKSIVLLCCIFGFSMSTFADEAKKNTSLQGNKGYVYMNPNPQAKAEVKVHELPNLVKGIKRLDSWIEKNLW